MCLRKAFLWSIATAERQTYTLTRRNVARESLKQKLARVSSRKLFRLETPRQFVRTLYIAIRAQIDFLARTSESAWDRDSRREKLQSLRMCMVRLLG